MLQLFQYISVRLNCGHMEIPYVVMDIFSFIIRDSENVFVLIEDWVYLQINHINVGKSIQYYLFVVQSYLERDVGNWKVEKKNLNTVTRKI